MLRTITNTIDFRTLNGMLSLYKGHIAITVPRVDMAKQQMRVFWEKYKRDGMKANLNELKITYPNGSVLFWSKPDDYRLAGYDGYNLPFHNIYHDDLKNYPETDTLREASHVE